MKMHNLILIAACTGLTFAGPLLLAEDAPKVDGPSTVKVETKAETAPSTTQPSIPAPKAQISPEVQGMIDEVAVAYGNLKTLQLTGTVAVNIHAAGRVEGGTTVFTSSYESPNKFRHEAANEILINSNGDQLFAYQKQGNMFAQAAAPKEKVATRELPKGFRDILLDQNPSLRLALAKDPGHELIEGATKIVKLDDAKIGDIDCPTLRFTLADKTTSTLSVDPSTHLIRQVVNDVRAELEAKGVAEVKKADYVISYTAINSEAVVKPDEFAFVVPDGAKNVKDMKETKSPGDDEDEPALALVGKPAADFKLGTLDGKEVVFAQLKGKVIVLDFWATWCPPCVASLPHLDKFYQDHKAAGVEVFAINMQEEKEKVQDFATKAKLGLPILLDLEGKTVDPYMAQGLPETVVVGKDGKIVKVFIGFNEKTSPVELAKVVEAALAK